MIALLRREKYIYIYTYRVKLRKISYPQLKIFEAYISTVEADVKCAAAAQRRYSKIYASRVPAEPR